MIKFTKLKWKNLLSTGNQFTELALDKSPTTLVLGINGSGKSTFLDALCYVLYKKPFRKINLPQLVNTINNGDCLVEVEFEIGSHSYHVRRGIKPAIFEIYEDGNLEPRHQAAGTKDDQAYLEEDILQVNYESFTQLVILGNAKYTPFMQLTTPKRREFVEEILDLDVFGIMHEIVKGKIKNIGIKLDTLDRDIESNEEKIKLVDGFIIKLETERKKVTADTQRQIDKQNEIIDGLTPTIEDLQNQVSTATANILHESERLNELAQEKVDAIQAAHDQHIAELDAQILDFSAITTKVAKLSSSRDGIQRNIKTYQTELSFYRKNDSCNTCKQTIHQDFKVKIIADKEAKIAEYEEALTKLETTIASYEQTIADTKKANADVQSQISKAFSSHQSAVQKILLDTRTEIKTLTSAMQASLTTLQADLQAKQSTVSAARQFVKKMEADIKASNAAANIVEQENKRKSYVSIGESLQADREAAIELQHYYGLASTFLKDTGIKAAIIKQYLSTINKLVNKYLSDMDFFVSFHLDENFNDTFKSRHRDTMSYNSFSEGEKMRIDLALLFAWRDVARMKNSCATNLLILDEVIDSSLDHNGTDFFIKMLNDLANTNEASNVFVISHKNDAALDKFKDVIYFSKYKNFSRLDDGGSSPHG